MELKVGDKVRIKPLTEVISLEGVKDWDYIRNPMIVVDMVNAFGKEAIVNYVYNNTVNRVKLESKYTHLPYSYDLNWIEKVEEEIETKFKAGDKVKLKTIEEVLDLEGVSSWGQVENPGIVNDMLNVFGKEVIISHINNFSRNIEIEGWAYKKEWIDKLVEEKIEAKFEEKVEEDGIYHDKVVFADDDLIDEVENTVHYNIDPNFEVIKALKAWLTKEEFIGFCKGNVIKYNVRAKHKGKESLDYKKAEYYQKQINNY